MEQRFLIPTFHAGYEKIHPFYDGNRRTGQLIMFRECLRSNIVPFIITDQYKGHYDDSLTPHKN